VVCIGQESLTAVAVITGIGNSTEVSLKRGRVPETARMNAGRLAERLLQDEVDTYISFGGERCFVEPKRSQKRSRSPWFHAWPQAFFRNFTAWMRRPLK
jgi:hypothetical protein